jgi:NADP-dependent 3-hydroxy acid dehydrogenase YdfG
MSQTHPKHIIVTTGATSCLGAQAVKQLAALPGKCRRIVRLRYTQELIFKEK